MRFARVLFAAATLAALFPLLPARAGGGLRVARVNRRQGPRASYRDGELIVQFRPTVDDQVADRAMYSGVKGGPA